MKSFPIRAVLVLGAAYGGICLLFFVIQRSFIYFPTEARPSAPVLVLQTREATLHITARQLEGPGALIYFGGNAEDVYFTLPEFVEAFPDRAIYMPHYRGYGGSSGKPSEAALHSDARHVFDWVMQSHQDVMVVGRSLGSAVAVRLAATAPVSRLVLVTPFDSILNLGRQRFPFLPVGILLIDRFESWRFAPEVVAPTMIVAASHDEVVPMESTMRLYRAFQPEVAEILVIQGAGHNSLSYLREIRP